MRTTNVQAIIKAEAVQQSSSTHPSVRVHSAVGAAVVLWRGALDATGREQHVEWTVDEEIFWARNAGPAASATPELREDGDRIVFRGRLSLTEDGAAVLDVGGALVLFDVAEPSPPDDADGSWIEVQVGRESVSVWPSEL
jgi:hypothetical protein